MTEEQAATLLGEMATLNGSMSTLMTIEEHNRQLLVDCRFYLLCLVISLGCVIGQKLWDVALKGRAERW